MIEDFKHKLNSTLERIDQEYGGDVICFPPIDRKTLECFEKKISWHLPEIFSYFYTQNSNGLIIDDKRILGFYVKNDKKTWVENLERMNDPQTSPWFKGRSEIFKDYVIIGTDNSLLFCLSKRYPLANPVIYICKNPNHTKGVDFERLDLDLENLISEMMRQAF